MISGGRERNFEPDWLGVLLAVAVGASDEGLCKGYRSESLTIDCVPFLQLLTVGAELGSPTGSDGIVDLGSLSTYCSTRADG